MKYDAVPTFSFLWSKLLNLAQLDLPNTTVYSEFSYSKYFGGFRVRWGRVGIQGLEQHGPACKTSGAVCSEVLDDPEMYAICYLTTNSVTIIKSNLVRSCSGMLVGELFDKAPWVFDGDIDCGVCVYDLQLFVKKN